MRPERRRVGRRRGLVVCRLPERVRRPTQPQASGGDARLSHLRSAPDLVDLARRGHVGPGSRERRGTRTRGSGDRGGRHRRGEGSRWVPAHLRRDRTSRRGPPSCRQGLLVEAVRGAGRRPRGGQVARPSDHRGGAAARVGGPADRGRVDASPGCPGRSGRQPRHGPDRRLPAVHATSPPAAAGRRPAPAGDQWQPLRRADRHRGRRCGHPPRHHRRRVSCARPADPVAHRRLGQLGGGRSCCGRAGADADRRRHPSGSQSPHVNLSLRSAPSWHTRAHWRPASTRS